jgi:hypothetical protein
MTFQLPFCSERNRKFVRSFPLSFSDNLYRPNRLIVDKVASDDNKVLDGSAEVAQPTTPYVFTGPGSQEAGMGMEWISTIRLLQRALFG